MKKLNLLYAIFFFTGTLLAQTYNYSNKFAVDFDVMGQDQDWYLDIIEANEAWDLTRGRSDVIIAYVCGSGVNWEHEDLGQDSDNFDNLNRGNSNLELWPTWNVPDDDGSDSDGNGYEDDWRGVVFYSNGVITTDYTNDTRPFEPAIYHGTWIAGIMSAKNIGSNGINGIAGGSQDGPGNSLLITGTENLIHEWFYIDDAIEYAINNGAQIILLDIEVSYTTSGWSDIAPALDDAIENDVFVVAPTGWTGINKICFPSSYKNNNTGRSVFSVGASTEPDGNGGEFRHSGSNYFQGYQSSPSGETDTKIDLVAPGEHIYTTGNDGDDDYVYVKGTTPAASMVAATVGLMLSVNPDLTYERIEEILYETAEKINNEVNGGDYDYDWDSNLPGHSKECGYGRLNTHRAVCAALADADAPVVLNGAIWDEPVYSLNDIHVPEDFTLTIESTVYMGPDAAFIIEQGATVTIDGGKLTNYKFCDFGDDMWPGVEVWGDDEKSQYVCQGTQAQGKIIIKNGGTIENAEIGVLLGARGEESYNWDMAGGIIRVANSGVLDEPGANFINNKYAIYFLPYENFRPDYFGDCVYVRDAWNLSYLYNCHFEVNQDYLNTETGWWFAHIYFHAVEGVKVGGCTFENNKYSYPRGHGINSYGAGFFIEAISKPGVPYDECEFTNFKKGINLSTNGARSFSVQDAIFQDNSIGINLTNVNNPSILFNDFLLGEPTSCDLQQDAAFGVDLYSCSGFAIEENDFAKAQGVPTGYYIGIRVNECPSYHDIIYKNNFDGLNQGNLAQGTNRLNSLIDSHGVEYQCNTNTGNTVDFIVTGLPGQVPMIRTYQGTSSISAGNTFSQGSGVQWHFRNEGTQTINYWWYLGNSVEEPEYYCTPFEFCFFDPFNADENSCPSHYGGSGGSSERGLVLSPDQMQDTETAYAEALINYNNVESLYNSLV